MLRNILFAFAVLFAANAMNVAHAKAAEPYGGCDEAWQAPHSAGAEWCRDHGYVVPTRYFPEGVRPCRHEDGSSQWRCVWDARHMGNGEGDSVLSLHRGAEYRVITHERAHRLIHRWRINH